MSTLTRPPLPRGLVITASPCSSTSAIGNPIVFQPRHLPPPAAEVAAADLGRALQQVPHDGQPAEASQSSWATPKSKIAGPMNTDVSATRPVMTTSVPCSSASTIG